jgi:hypothetical protein
VVNGAEGGACQIEAGDWGLGIGLPCCHSGASRNLFAPERMKDESRIKKAESRMGLGI